MVRIIFINISFVMFFLISVCVCVYYFGMLLISICRIFLYIKYNILFIIVIKFFSYLDKFSNFLNKICIFYLYYMLLIYDILNIEYLYINIIIG